MDYEDDLEDRLGDDTTDFDQPPRALADDLAADRLLRRYRREHVELARLHAVADARVEEIRQWEQDCSAGPLRALEWLSRSLEGYMRAAAQQDGRLRSLKLPSGTLKLRKPPGKVLVLDFAVLVAQPRNPDWWRLRPYPRIVAVKEAPSLTALASLPRGEPTVIEDADGGRVRRYPILDDRGTPIPGVAYEEREQDNFGIGLESR